MHSPEPWGTSSQPLTDLEWTNLKARIYRVIRQVPRVYLSSLQINHFPKDAAFVRKATEELKSEGVVKKLPNGSLLAV